MQIPNTETEMKLDLDLFRDLLAAIEADDRFDGQSWITPDRTDTLGILGVKPQSDREVSYHLNLLIEGGFIKGKTSIQERMPMISRLTLKGHELLSMLAEPQVNSKTKKRLEGLTTYALQTVLDIGKQELYKLLGL